MEEFTVVYFVTDEKAVGRKKKGARWQYHVEKESFAGRNAAKQIVHFVTAYLPLYERRSRWERFLGEKKGRESWRTEELREYMEGLPVPAEGREVHYLYEEKAGAILGRTEEPLSAAWLFFLLDYCREGYDALLILQDREMEGEEILKRYVQEFRYIGVVAGEEESFQRLEEELEEEYGLLLHSGGSLKQVSLPRGEKILIVAGEKLYDAVPLLLPPESLWVSIKTTGTGGKRICARARNVNYLDIKIFLQKFTRNDCIFQKIRL